jgi:uncharacterized protein (UPF0371 family)
MQEIQSRARSDATNLQLAQEDNTSLKEALSQEGKEKNMVQQKVDEMENQIQAVFQAISDNEGVQEASSQEKMRKIVQTLQQYKEQIKELEERAVPMTPPEVRAQREQDVTTSAENIMQNIHRMTELLEKSAQLWTQILEDGSLQELQGKEENCMQQWQMSNNDRG